MLLGVAIFIMDLSNLKKLVLLGVAAGVSAAPVVAEESASVAEANYYVAGCGQETCRSVYQPSTAPNMNQGQSINNGEPMLNGQPMMNNGQSMSHGQPANNGNAPPTYNQTNPAPTVVPQPKSTQTQAPNAAWYEKGMQPQSQGMQQQPSQSHVAPKADGQTTSRYYQKRDRELSDASMDSSPSTVPPGKQSYGVPPGKPSNGLPPGNPSNGMPPSGNNPSSAMKPAAKPSSSTNNSSKY